MKTLATCGILCLLLNHVLAQPDFSFYYIPPSAERFEYQNVVTGESSDDIEYNINAYFDWAEENNINFFLAEAIWIGSDDPKDEWSDALIWFKSDLLYSKGFKQQSLVLEKIIEEGHSRGHDIYLNIEHLAHAIYNFKPHSIGIGDFTPNDIGILVDELYALGIDGVYEEAFGDEYIQVIYEKAQAHGIKYFHCFNDTKGRGDVWLSEDYVFYPSSHEYIEYVKESGVIANTIGNLSLTFAHANELNKPVIVSTAGHWGLQPGMQNNIALYRMIQFDPVGYNYWAASEEDKQYLDDLNEEMVLGAWLEEMHNYFGDAYKERPRANLIIDEPTNKQVAEELWFTYAMVNALDFITNSLSAAGYELFVTYNKPSNDEMDAYFIYTLGDYSDLAELIDIELGYDEISTDLVGLFNSDKPVGFITTYGLPNSENWKQVIQAVGLSTDIDYQTHYSASNKLPQNVNYKANEYRFAGFDLAELGYFWEDIGTNDVTGNLIASGIIDDEERVMIVGNGNKYFINGNNLHMEASAILAQEFAPKVNEVTFNDPSHIYMSVGEITAIMAVETSNLNIELPYYNHEALLVEFDRNGREVYREKTEYSGSLQYELNEWSLLIIDNRANLTSMSEPKSNVIKVFPNPVSDELHVNYHERVDMVIISDLQGRLLHSSFCQSEIASISLSDFKEGLYILTVRIGNEYYTEKIIVK